MPNLFPVGYENELSTAADLQVTQPIGYKPSADFDFEQGDFIRNGAKQVESNSGVAAWEAWCKTCLLTDRYNHSAYTTDSGIDDVTINIRVPLPGGDY